MTTTPMARAAVVRSTVERIIREARANSECPNLRWFNMHGADLSELDLCGADLTGAILTGTNLRGVDLRWANLSDVPGVVGLGDTPSGVAYMVPLPDGTWQLTVGYWSGTADELRELIAGDNWPNPNVEGAERDRRRTLFAALADFADVQAAYRADWLEAVVERWGSRL